MAYAQLPQVENVTLTASALVDLVTAVSVQHLQTANVTPTVNVLAAPATVVNAQLPAVNVIPIVSALVDLVIAANAQQPQMANVTPTVNVLAAPATVVNVPLPAVNVIPIVSVLVEVVIMESALIQNNTSQF